jgi:hypothetical protein
MRCLLFSRKAISVNPKLNSNYIDMNIINLLHWHIILYKETMSKILKSKIQKMIEWGELNMKERFIGYSFEIAEFNSDHTAPTYLEGEEAAWEYVYQNMNKWARTIVIDLGDEIVIEAINGEVVFPKECASKG